MRSGVARNSKLIMSAIDDEFAKFQAEIASLGDIAAPKPPAAAASTAVAVAAPSKPVAAKPKVAVQRKPSAAPVHTVVAAAKPAVIQKAPVETPPVPQETWTYNPNPTAPPMPLSMPRYGAPVPSQPTKPVAVPQSKKHVRVGGGEVWVDPTLDEWPESTSFKQSDIAA